MLQGLVKFFQPAKMSTEKKNKHLSLNSESKTKLRHTFRPIIFGSVQSGYCGPVWVGIEVPRGETIIWPAVFERSPWHPSVELYYTMTARWRLASLGKINENERVVVVRRKIELRFECVLRHCFGGVKLFGKTTARADHVYSNTGEHVQTGSEIILKKK